MAQPLSHYRQMHSDVINSDTVQGCDRVIPLEREQDGGRTMVDNTNSRFRQTPIRH